MGYIQLFGPPWIFFMIIIIIAIVKDNLELLFYNNNNNSNYLGHPWIVFHNRNNNICLGHPWIDGAERRSGCVYKHQIHDTNLWIMPHEKVNNHLSSNTWYPLMNHASWGSKQSPLIKYIIAIHPETWKYISIIVNKYLECLSNACLIVIVLRLS